MSADTTSPASADALGRRAALESSWQQKATEIRALSKAYYGLDGGGLAPVSPGLRRSRRRRARMAAAHEQLAVIEDALARPSRYTSLPADQRLS